MDTAPLHGIQLFRDLTPDELAVVAKNAFEKKYNDAATLFMENMPGEVMYVVKAGGVDLSKKGPDGEDKIFITLKPGDFFGEMSLIDESPRSATARVKGTTDLVVFTKKAFREMLQNDPRVAAKVLLNLLKVVNQRLRRTTDLVKNV